METKFNVVNTKTGEIRHEANTLSDAIDTIEERNWTSVKIEPVVEKEAETEE